MKYSVHRTTSKGYFSYTRQLQPKLNSADAHMIVLLAAFIVGMICAIANVALAIFAVPLFTVIGSKIGRKY